MPAITDLAGLNLTTVSDMPIVSDDADLPAIWHQDERPLSLAGMRGSQGGHTMIDGGRQLLTEAWSRPLEVDVAGYDPRSPRAEQAVAPNFTAPAGATWAQVHRMLAPLGLAPLVHQSSAHFSVGGSLSVNCHGRDPRQGPLSSVVNWIDVWLPGEGMVRASPTQNRELFVAVLGGYGACGPVVRANFRAGPNLRLQQTGWLASRARYARHLSRLATPGPEEHNIGLHYGWLRCASRADLFDEVLVVDYRDDGGPQADDRTPLRKEDWGTTEILRAGWAAARQGDEALRASIWEQVVRQTGQKTDSRINWMRAPLSFASHRSADRTDILQEYFVPLAALEPLLDGLRVLLREPPDAVVLSATVRLVQPDTLPVHLSWCPSGPMACVALDLSVPLADGEPRPDVRARLMDAVSLAHGLGGTFYLPYWRFVPRALMEACYGPGWALQRQAIARFNPRRRWWNAFLEAYA